jgi:hypothetical protein
VPVFAEPAKLSAHGKTWERAKADFLPQFGGLLFGTGNCPWNLMQYEGL